MPKRRKVIIPAVVALSTAGSILAGAAAAAGPVTFVEAPSVNVQMPASSANLTAAIYHG